ncbi:FUSC family protein [Deinococcus sp. RM]|uniref:FUSC family protein n=1 Tax=Deinococcus sp. RM TaxID=2316359 RepID=UPI000E67894E|nr:FUSC family protein [Deinococcus sp. RM]RIX97636.1 FUSC family protein [Deinococcus sp. RM]
MLTRRSLILRAAVRLNWSQFRPWLALRSTVGVAIPVLLGTATGHAVWGVVAAVGALMAGMASFHGVYRARAGLMVTVSLGMAVAAGLGDLLAQQDALAIAGVALLSLLLARYTATPLGANTVIIQAFTVQSLLLGFPDPGLGPLGTAGLVLAGGLIQTVLLVAVWPVNPRRAERQAVAAAFESLALFVASLAAPGASRLPGVVPFQGARTILADAQRRASRPEHDLLIQTLRQGEALHAALVGFAQADLLVRQTGAVGKQQADAALTLLEALLRNVARRVRRGQPAALPGSDLDGFQAAVFTMERALPDENLAAHQEYAEWTGILLFHLRQLRAHHPNRADPVVSPQAAPAAVGQPVLQGHVLRFTVAMTLATALERLLNIPSGFWIPLTVCLVLRPEFAVTVHRGVTRVAGTLVGVGVALMIMLSLAPHGLVLAGALIAAAWLAYALFLTNYAVFSAVITVYIILSLSAAGAAGDVLDVSGRRLLATLLGGAIALGSYLVWPTWHAPQVQGVLWTAVDAQLAFAQSLTRRAVGEPDLLLDERRGHARRWRLRADDLLQAALVEPRWPSDLPRPLAQHVVTALNANAAALLVIQARMDAGPTQPSGALEASLAHCVRTAEQLRASLQPYAAAAHA